MRVLFAAYAEKTHFLSMVPLAWALHNAGHEVRVASQPGLTDVITRAGLSAVPVGTNHNLGALLKFYNSFDPEEDEPVEHFDFLEEREEKLTWEYLKWGYGTEVVPWWWRVINDPLITELTAFCRSWRPDLVIWEPITYAAPIAARACGAAHARFLWSVDLFARMRGHYVRVRDRQPPDQRVDTLAEWLDRRAAKFGLGFTEDMTCGQFTLDPTPPALRLPLDLAYVPVRYVPYNGVSVVEPWLRVPPERPRIGITLGTSAIERLSGYGLPVREILDALADLDVEVVAALPGAEPAGLPDNVRLASFVPLDVLAPTCTVMINHGGPGTVFTTARHGVPQLTMPAIFDELVLGRRLAQEGAGLMLDQDQVSGDSVRNRVVRLLADTDFAQGAARLRAQMRAMPHPHQVVGELERLTEECRGLPAVVG
ncbi:activator-dependent family glycosyltransferase [Nonomuraea sp. NN258]|uniref:activator-dependent family glycosyltransferase n=1 Tax=Nonomuraea antri TaxID=2730852 RepID=UPI001568A9B6|nr:activator-dependent family glycosyltransferase [Nonomuraea antri]NRQ31677.1 activator-dependent family glycosyltransferase [Nonomuraea antri]